MTQTKEEKEAKAKAKAEKKALKKADKEAKEKAKDEANGTETKTRPTNRPAIFKYVGKDAGRHVGKEFFPHPEYGTVMVPAAEGDQRIQVAKGETVEITDPGVIKRLDTNLKWERIK